MDITLIRRFAAWHIMEYRRKNRENDYGSLFNLGAIHTLKSVTLGGDLTTYDQLAYILARLN